MAADRQPNCSAAKVGESLTHCSECGQPFWEPVANWADFFSTVEEASFMCSACADEFDGTAANAR